MLHRLKAERTEPTIKKLASLGGDFPKGSHKLLLAMDIILFRHRDRALILPRGKDLIDCPLLVRHWLGIPFSENITEITVDTPMPGINPPLVLAELLQKGFCALDVYGVVHAFDSPPLDSCSDLELN